MCGDSTGSPDDYCVGCFHGQLQYILYNSTGGPFRWKSGDWFGDHW